MKKRTAAPALLDVDQVAPPEEHPEEFFPTPATAIRAIAPFLATLPGGPWLGPCAGAGAIPRVLGAIGTVRWDLCELRATERPRLSRLMKERPWDIREVECPCNYLHRTPPAQRYAVGVDNPPFSLAARFKAKLREECEHVVLLLPFGFLETVSRGRMHRADPPDVRILSKRPSFTGDGHTDGIGYAWFSWPGTGRIEWLLPAGLEEQEELAL